MLVASCTPAFAHIHKYRFARVDIQFAKSIFLKLFCAFDTERNGHKNEKT